jgi:hypothetical protein
MMKLEVNLTMDFADVGELSADCSTGIATNG